LGAAPKGAAKKAGMGRKLPRLERAVNEGSRDPLETDQPQRAKSLLEAPSAIAIAIAVVS